MDTDAAGFIALVVVWTTLIATVLGALLWAAVLDGHDERAHRARIRSRASRT